MNSLASRLSLAVLAIVTLAGVAFYIVDRFSTTNYYEELTQRLNAPIAGYVTQQGDLIVDGQPVVARLRELANLAMTINPSVEIYLLDTLGRILAHELPEESVVRNIVDLEPLLALLNDDMIMPLRGDDPRSLDGRKIFSVAEVRQGEDLQGYLYVVLGGEKYDAIAADLGSSYVRRISLGAVISIVIAAGLVGLLLVRLLTTRLRKLSGAVRDVTAADFQKSYQSIGHTSRRDEIDALDIAFDSMARRIRALLAELKSNDELRRELVSNVSHDLRTPLTTMQGYIETLMIREKTLQPSERETYVKIIWEHSRRLGGLIAELFELSKLETANMVVHSETFSLPELLQDIAQDFRLEARAKGIDIDVELAGNIEKIYADIGLIQRVFENLIRNAISCTPAGGRIELKVTDGDDRVSVSVADTGAGIAAADLPRIFDRFYRVARDDRSLASSSGLGLAIVKRILDLHGSRIAVSSVIGVGTRFEFSLPTLRMAA